MTFAIPVYTSAQPGHAGPQKVTGFKLFEGYPVMGKKGLPPPTTTRWVVRRKAEVAAAVAVGLLSWDEVTTLYRFRREDVERWIENLKQGGLPALRETQVQSAPVRASEVVFDESIPYTHPLARNADGIITWKGEVVHGMTGKERELLGFLLAARGASLSKDAILKLMYPNPGDEPELKIIDVFICKIRKKMKALSGGSQYIETVWGSGYCIPPEAVPDKELATA